MQHSHGQIYGYPSVPPRPERKPDAARECKNNNGTCSTATSFQEQADGRHVIRKAGHFMALVPFYAHYPYKAHLYPDAARPP